MALWGPDRGRTGWSLQEEPAGLGKILGGARETQGGMRLARYFTSGTSTCSPSLVASPASEAESQWPGAFLAGRLLQPGSRVSPELESQGWKALQINLPSHFTEGGVSQSPAPMGRAGGGVLSIETHVCGPPGCR